MGKATPIATSVVKIVPDKRGRIPYDFLENKGVHSVAVRNSKRLTSLKKTKDWDNSTQIIPMVVNIVRMADAWRPPSIIFSFNLNYLLLEHDRKTFLKLRIPRL